MRAGFSSFASPPHMKRERQQRRACNPPQGAEAPFQAQDRAVLVALAEVVVAGQLDDVGDVDLATTASILELAEAVVHELMSRQKPPARIDDCQRSIILNHGGPPTTAPVSPTTL